MSDVVTRVCGNKGLFWSLVVYGGAGTFFNLVTAAVLARLARRYLTGQAPDKMDHSARAWAITVLVIISVLAAAVLVWLIVYLARRR